MRYRCAPGECRGRRQRRIMCDSAHSFNQGTLVTHFLSLWRLQGWQSERALVKRHEPNPLGVRQKFRGSPNDQKSSAASSLLFAEPSATWGAQF